MKITLHDFSNLGIINKLIWSWYHPIWQSMPMNVCMYNVCCKKVKKNEYDDPSRYALSTGPILITSWSLKEV